MNTSLAPSLLIVDDDVELTSLLDSFFDSQGFLVSLRHNVKSGLRMAKSGFRFNLILLDVMLPDGDGFDALKSLRETHKTPVIMLTAKNRPAERVKGLEYGADDFVSKPFDGNELLARVKAVLRRTDDRRNYQCDVLNNGVLKVHTKKLEVYLREQLVPFTQTEAKIITGLMANCGHVVAKHELHYFTFQRRLTAHDRTIDMHVSNIRKKFASFQLPQLIKTIRNQGYMMLDDVF